MSQPPICQSSSIGSSSSFTSSKSSLLALQTDAISSQSDITDFHSMPRGDPYDIAASPSHGTSKAVAQPAPPVSATQILKRAFVKRRRPSHDAAMILSSGEESWSSSPAALSGAASPSLVNSSNSKPLKITKHLFGSRKHIPQPEHHLPPPVPPKPPPIHPPPSAILPVRGSIMVASPSINAAIEFMRTEEEERQRVTVAAPQRREIVDVSRTLDERKEQWRRSDSTMDSGHTVRPGFDGGSKQTSPLLPSPSEMDPTLNYTGAPLTETSHQDSYGADLPMATSSKRRSVSLNIHIPHSLSSTSPSFNISQYSTPTTQVVHNIIHSSPLESFNPGGPIPPSSSSTVPVSRPNLRDRFAAWTVGGHATRSHSPSPSLLSTLSTSSPSLVSAPAAPTHSFQTSFGPRPYLASDAWQNDMHAGLPGTRVRSPSNSSLSSAGGIRQAASGALEFGKRAYEKVGRVWGGSGYGSGSGSDTSSYRHPSPVNPPGFQSHQHHNSVAAPSAFNRRTPGSHSGMWPMSAHSTPQSGLRMSHEQDSNAMNGRETPINFNYSPPSLGRLVRPPKYPNGGFVFKRELWECVKDTRINDPSARDELAQRMIPALVYRCVQHLHKWGLDEEGLFRVAGRSSHITRLRKDFDGGADYDIIECSPSDLDPHAVASVFKAYLRELPESILTKNLSPSFDNAISMENSTAAPLNPTGMVARAMEQAAPGLPNGPRQPSMPISMLRKPPSLSTFTLPTSASLRAPSAALVETLSELISRLPRENYDLLLTVVELIKATAARCSVTKMPLSNLLLVFCPSLGMPPGLLRAICDSTQSWEKAALLRDIQNERVADEYDDDSMASDSDSDIDYEAEGEMSNTERLKNKGKEVPIQDVSLDGDNDGSELGEPLTDEDVVLVPRGAKPGAFSEHNKNFGSAVPSRPVTPVYQASLSTHVSASGRSSPYRSEVSLTSLEIEDKSSVSTQKFPSVSPVETRSVPKWASINYEKDLPMFPQTPTSGETATLPQSTMTTMPAIPPYPLAHALLVPPVGAHPVQHSQIERAQNPRSATLPHPSAVASKSAPSVIFPSYGTAPSTPTKKHGLSLSLSKNAKMSNDDGSPTTPVTPSKRVGRRPSMNLLFSKKRSGSPVGHIRSLTISSPITPFSLHEKESTSSLKTTTDSSPPILSLPTVETDLGRGLGWEDEVFGANKDSETSLSMPQARVTALSQPTPQTSSLTSAAPPSPSRRPTTEYLLSSGGFFSQGGPPSVLPSAEAVLETGDAIHSVQAIEIAHTKHTGLKAVSIRSASPADFVTGAFREDVSSSGDDSPPLSSPKEPFSPPPHINLPLKGTSLEDDEDWASAVLWAAGKPDAFDS